MKRLKGNATQNVHKDLNSGNICFETFSLRLYLSV